MRIQFEFFDIKVEELKSKNGKHAYTTRPDKARLEELQDLVRNIVELKGSLAEDQKERLEKIGIFKMGATLDALGQLPIWDGGSMR